MIRTFSAARSVCYALAGIGTLALGGCGGFDGVALNGKVFDAMGMNGTTTTAEPKLAQRTGLVVPPNTGALPAPGSRPDGDAPDVAALHDPDKTAKRQQAEYCKVNYEMAKARGDDNADLAAGPLGPCRGSALTALQDWQKGGKEDDEAE